ncbi:hypothetical protein Ait01nite_013180 [Actinoplanes italicus]|uniref:Uncharacterized protein n=1 Tax=Actinoplanes italicus TaxID=113567 RepID=A0A2T0KH47_9ACTN|nr:hypothetical protein [Actinoplanes italicus]PRX22751.1 hypothetical protein CLV67_104279 [Actinoplanes italicus]GIE28273.1 hypothetical protein Ait01nite_013180 [Actinoplanes italicus]
MTVPPARIDRVLGDGPFREIGLPRVTATSPDRTLIAVGGAHVAAQWHGRAVGSRSRPRPGRHPVAVHRTADLACLHHTTTGWPVNALAFHPTRPLLAIGAGAYDGGYLHEGELLLLDLSTGDTVSLLQYPREVRQITWRDPDTLDLVLAIPCDDDQHEGGSTSLACSLRRDDWDRPATGMLRVPYAEAPHADPPGPDPAAAADAVRRLSPGWAPRRAVWAVEGLADGRILAAHEGVALECWAPASADPDWQVTAGGTGYQVHVAPGGRTARVLTQASRAGRRTLAPSLVQDVDLDDGRVLSTRQAATPAIMVGRADGRWALRGTGFDADAWAGEVTLIQPDEVTVRELGRYDLFNHYFDIRYAPDLLFLKGRGDKPWARKRVVAVDTPAGQIRELFPLEWDPARGGHLSGGCGAYLDDRDGPAIVHTGEVHNGRGPLPGNAFVVRRAYPSGQARWVFTADSQATALDADAEHVYVTFNSGELVILRTADGTAVSRQHLRVGGHPVVPLSLARAGAGRLAIGTLDGRVLDCRVWREPIRCRT